MSYAHSVSITNATLRQQDFSHFRAMLQGSAKLRDRVREERGMEPHHEAPPSRISRKCKPRKVRRLPAWKDGAAIQTAAEFIDAIASAFNLDASELTGPSRARDLSPARFTAMYVLVKRGASRNAVGKWLGGRDHSTVINGLNRFEADATPFMRAVAERFIAMPKLGEQA
jgi:hypothetical protein